MPNFTKEQLERLYSVEKKSFDFIAASFNVGHTTVEYWLKKWGINIRSRQEGQLVRYGRKLPNLAAINDRDWEILAWVIAAEGWIGFRTYALARPAVGVGNTEKSFIENLTKKYPDLGNISVGARGKHKTMYQWQIAGLNVIKEVLNGILPYLPIKVDVAVLVRDYCSLRLRHPTSSYTLQELELIKEVWNINPQRGKRKLTLESRYPNLFKLKEVYHQI